MTPLEKWKAFLEREAARGTVAQVFMANMLVYRLVAGRFPTFTFAPKARPLSPIAKAWTLDGKSLWPQSKGAVTYAYAGPERTRP